MTDLVLVNPPVSARERYGPLAGGGSHLPPLGLALLAGIARKAGFSVEIVDAEALGMTVEEAAHRALSSEPSIIGLTSVTMTVHAAAEVARLVKLASPSTIVALGGVHISATPEQTMEAFPAIDVGVIGEGDVTLPEMLAAVRDRWPFDDIRGLILRERGGRLRRTGERETVEDLDSLPFPAWDLLPNLAKAYRPAPNAYRSLPASSVVSSRGCPGRCTFCDRTVSGRRLRTYSAGYLMRMVETLHARHGIREIVFHDDNFVASRPRLLEFCALLERSGLGIEWSCTGRVDMIDPEVLAVMRRAGCWQIAYGVETGSQRLLDELRKGTTLEQIRQAVAWTHEAGIEARGYFMIGVPGETPETLDQTLRLLRELPLDDFHMTILAPHPGSEITGEIMRRRPIEIDWRRCGDWDVVYVPDGLTREDLESAHRKAFRGFYLRPQVIMRYVRRVARHPGIAAGLSRGLLAWMMYTVFGPDTAQPATAAEPVSLELPERERI